MVTSLMPRQLTALTAPSRAPTGAGTRRAGCRPRRGAAGAASSTDVEQHRAVDPQQLDRCPARDLRRVAHAVEHRLPREQAADPHAVEPADQRAVAPGLDAVRPTELVQPAVRGDERLVDPAVRARRVRAAAYHRLERWFDAHLEARDRAAQRAAAVEAVERDHTARSGDHQASTPSTRIGNRPAPVCIEHRARLEVTPDRNHVVGPRLSGIRQLPARGLRLLRPHPNKTSGEERARSDRPGSRRCRRRSGAPWRHAASCSTSYSAM